MLAKKWVIYDGQLLISSSVEFHSEILPENYDKKKVQGGGRWEILDNRLYEDRIIFFYGISTDFGSASPEAFKQAYEATALADSITQYTPLFSTKEWFSAVIKEYLANKTN